MAATAMTAAQVNRRRPAASSDCARASSTVLAPAAPSSVLLEGSTPPLGVAV